MNKALSVLELTVLFDCVPHEKYYRSTCRFVELLPLQLLAH